MRTRCLTLALLALLWSPTALGAEWSAFRPDTSGSFRFKIELEQSLRSTGDDALVESQALVRKIEAWFKAGWRAASAGPASMKIELNDFELSQMLGENEIAPVGADKMSELELLLPFDSAGPKGLVRLGEHGDLDASVWSVMQPLSEAVRHAIQLSLPVLLGRHGSWVVVRKVPLGLPGAPDLEMEIVSAYVVQGLSPCSCGQCLMVEEVISAMYSDFRPLGGTLVLVELEGLGQASHRFSLDQSLPCSVEGKLDMTVRLHTQVVPGLPMYGTLTELSSRYKLTR